MEAFEYENVPRTTQAKKPKKASHPCLFSSLVFAADLQSKIFALLHLPSDVASARLVCREWATAVPRSVTSLDLSHLREKEESALISVLPAFSSLTSLCLPYALCTARVLSAVTLSCPNLTEFRNSSSPARYMLARGRIGSIIKFSPTALSRFLDSSPKLRILELKGSRFGDVCPSPVLLSPPAPLRALRLMGCNMPHPTGIPASSLDHLEELVVDNCKWPYFRTEQEALVQGEALFALVGRISGLRSLTLALENFDGPFSHRKRTEEPLPWLRHMEGLQSLDSLSIGGVCFARLALPTTWPQMLPSLRSLCLRGLRLSREDVALHMAQLTSLEIDSFSQSYVEDFALPKLRELRLTHADNIIALPALVLLTALTSLDLSYSYRLESLPPLTGFKQLRMLRLVNCTSLRTLPFDIVNLPRLRHIDICGCQELEVEPAIMRVLFTSLLQRLDWLTSPSHP